MDDITNETIVWERRGPLGILTLNRPEARNGITGRLMSELYACLQAAAEQEDLRVLLLTGAGRDFCPGADLKAHLDGSAGETPFETFGVGLLLHEMPAVTVAAIRGACAGAGLAWATACDLRVASSTAKFNTAFLDVGFSGDMGGAWTLSRVVGPAKARELYMLPQKFSAQEARDIGLVSRVFDDDQFDAGLALLMEELADKPPATLKTIKGNFVAAERMSLTEFVPFEAERHIACGRTRDAGEAQAAFVQKRRPVYEGR